MPSKQSEAVRRHWESGWLAMTQPGYEGPDNESWGDLRCSTTWRRRQARALADWVRPRLGL